MKLYWVTTDDHDEDWFIAASSSQAACRAHEEMEGDDRVDARAEAILRIPDDLSARPGWSSEALLRSLGAAFLHDGQPHVVEPRQRAHSPSLAAGLASEPGIDCYPYGAAKHCRFRQNIPRGLPWGGFK